MNHPIQTGLTSAELDGQQAERLPARQVLALVNLNAILAAVNASLAVNALTENSFAGAVGLQTIVVEQS